MNGCQRTPWSEELNFKELHGAAGGEYDREPKGFAFMESIKIFQASTMWCIYMVLVLKRWCFD